MKVLNHILPKSVAKAPGWSTCPKGCTVLRLIFRREKWMVSYVIYEENTAANGVVMLSRHCNPTTQQTAPELRSWKRYFSCNRQIAALRRARLSVRPWSSLKQLPGLTQVCLLAQPWNVLCQDNCKDWKSLWTQTRRCTGTVIARLAWGLVQV